MIRHVFLIGAARSGTKMLRGCLGALDGVDVVPYDVNFLWRSLAPGHPDDALPLSSRPVHDREVMNRFLGRYAGAEDRVLVEKTVSNCLRVPLIDQLFPEARFIHLVRDGYDVTESAVRQWQAKPDLRYLARKARHYPLRAGLGYAARHAMATIQGLVSPSTAMTTRVWGPRYPGIERDVAECELTVVCARQWAHSVQRASEALDSIPGRRVTTVRYEDFCTNFDTWITDLADFVGVEHADPVAMDPHIQVLTTNIGKARGTTDLHSSPEVRRIIDSVDLPD